jgi:cytochrome c553
MRSLALVVLLSYVTALAAAPSVDDGAASSVACQACHGGNGISVAPNIPNLAGQKTEYLKQQLAAFKSGDRKHDVMNPIARQLSDADIANLAAFWNSLPSGGSNRETAPAAALARTSTMAFPAEFPNGFTVYRTDEDAARQSVSRFYANATALQAARAGKALPDGSIIVVENSSAGKPASYSAMEARAGWGQELPQILRNGTWSYALFNAQRVRTDKPNYALCFGCHKAVEGDSYVFSLEQLRHSTG